MEEILNPQKITPHTKNQRKPTFCGGLNSNYWSDFSCPGCQDQRPQPQSWSVGVIVIVPDMFDLLSWNVEINNNYVYSPGVNFKDYKFSVVQIFGMVNYLLYFLALFYVSFQGGKRFGGLRFWGVHFFGGSNSLECQKLKRSKFLEFKIFGFQHFGVPKYLSPIIFTLPKFVSP